MGKVFRAVFFSCEVLLGVLIGAPIGLLLGAIVGVALYLVIVPLSLKYAIADWLARRNAGVRAGLDDVKNGRVQSLESIKAEQAGNRWTN